jgi:hypothetical protein
LKQLEICSSSSSSSSSSISSTCTPQASSLHGESITSDNISNPSTTTVATELVVEERTGDVLVVEAQVVTESEGVEKKRKEKEKLAAIQVSPSAVDAAASVGHHPIGLPLEVTVSCEPIHQETRSEPKEN